MNFEVRVLQFIYLCIQLFIQLTDICYCMQDSGSQVLILLLGGYQDCGQVGLPVFPLLLSILTWKDSPRTQYCQVGGWSLESLQRQRLCPLSPTCQVQCPLCRAVSLSPRVREPLFLNLWGMYIVGEGSYPKLPDWDPLGGSAQENLPVNNFTSWTYRDPRLWPGRVSQCKHYCHVGLDLLSYGAVLCTAGY